jgi:hypothetical protein
MMFTVEFDFHEFEAFAKQVNAAADQLPYALATMLNDGAFKARQVWIDRTWPGNVTVRNQAFMSAALHIDKATKTNLTVHLFDRLGRDYLQRLATGGIRRPVKARTLAVPLRTWIQYTAHGKPLRQQLHYILEHTPERALRVTDKGVFVGEGGRLQLRYSWHDQITQPQRVPFYADFYYVMVENMRTGFPDMLQKAMQTRRR